MTRARALPGTHPSHIPSIRDWIRENLQPNRGLSMAMDMSPQPGTSSHVERHGFADVKLFWVPTAECEIIAAAKDTLPADLTLSEDDLPYPSGFAVLERPFFGIAADSGDKMPVATKAFRWAPLMICEQDGTVTGPGVSMASWAYDVDSKGTEWWIPLGRTDWLYGQVWDEYFLDPSHPVLACVRDDRSKFMALWALMNSQKHEMCYSPTRAEVRRDARIAPMSEDRLIHVVRWQPRTYMDDERETTSGRKVHVRYHVEGFWRRTPYGPKHSLRHWTYIPPHWRGPKDAPIKGQTITINKVGQ